MDRAMIVDCHTHIWEGPEQLGRYGQGGGERVAGRRGWPEADTHRHFAAAEPVDKSIVLGFRSHYLGAHVPNDYVAHYVRQHPDRLIGFAGIDPSKPLEAVRETVRAHDELGMHGITVSPAAQDFHPASTAAMKLYAEANRLRMPVIFDQHALMTPGAKMEFARPFLLDEVAREFPDLRIIIAELGHPWIDETVLLLGKHANVFADIGGLLNNHWQAYNALLVAYQAEVMDKLLFASNFPFTSAATCIEALYSINQFCHGTNLPTIPREQLRRIVERNTLDLLRIPHTTGAAPRVASTQGTPDPAVRP
jgi:predicted TIM-barrel fold metal-dependent hydrolase